jgi:hypothetical protein
MQPGAAARLVLCLEACRSSHIVLSLPLVTTVNARTTEDVRILDLNTTLLRRMLSRTIRMHPTLIPTPTLLCTINLKPEDMPPPLNCLPTKLVTFQVLNTMLVVPQFSLCRVVWQVRR